MGGIFNILDAAIVAYFAYFFPFRPLGYVMAVFVAYRLFVDLTGPPEGIAYKVRKRPEGGNHDSWWWMR